MSGQNYYNILGVSQNESREGIIKAYSRLSKKYHPEKGDISKTCRFHEICNAYEILSDPEKRKKYDIEMNFNNSIVNDKINSFRGSNDILLGRKIDRLQNRTIIYELDTFLNIQEALSGVRTNIIMPFYVECSFCSVIFKLSFNECPVCKNTGLLKQERTINIQIPPLINHGDIIIIPLTNSLRFNINLKITFNIKT